MGIPPHAAMVWRDNKCQMKLVEQRSLLETKDALVAKTKGKLARSAKMQVRYNCQSNKSTF